MCPLGSSLELCFSLELHKDVNMMILFFFLSSPTSLAETDMTDRQTDVHTCKTSSFYLNLRIQFSSLLSPWFPEILSQKQQCKIAKKKLVFLRINKSFQMTIFVIEVFRLVGSERVSMLLKLFSHELPPSKILLSKIPCVFRF